MDLKIIVVQSEDKFYNMGFVDVENSGECIILESRCYGFGEGWMAAVNALDLLEESPFKDPEQIPLPEPSHPTPVQNPTHIKEGDSLSMRDLVEEIDSHTEVIDLDILSNRRRSRSTTPHVESQPSDNRKCYSFRADLRSQSLDLMFFYFLFLLSCL